MMKSKNINLNEIDPNVIIDIRSVVEDKEEYKILESAIKQDGQFNPITIRLLTDEEKQKAQEGAIYGIIDGHHRFNIALNNKKKSISANIDEQEASPVRDAMLAFQLNNTAIRMTIEEKGKAIEQLIKLTGKKAGEIGKEIFGLKTAMAYRCVQAFKNLEKNKNQRENANRGNFNAYELHNSINIIPNETHNINDWDVNYCIEQLKAVKKAESELRFYKRELLNKSGVKSEWLKQSKNQNNNQ